MENMGNNNIHIHLKLGTRMISTHNDPTKGIIVIHNLYAQVDSYLLSHSKINIGTGI